MSKIKLFGQSILLSTLIFILLTACNATEPPPVKDPRTMIWSVDTLIGPNNFQTNLRSFWGLKPNELFLAGHDGYIDGQLWYYDGKEWSYDKMPALPSSLMKVFGFSSTNVWAIGSVNYTNKHESLILHYDSEKWVKKDCPSKGGLISIWGSSPNDIWTGGTNTLLHFNGFQWKEFPILFPYKEVNINSIAGISKDEVYLTCHSTEQKDDKVTSYNYMYEYNGKDWTIIDTSYIDFDTQRYESFGSMFYVIDKKLYSCFSYIYQYENGKWIKINDESGIVRLGGTGENNILAAGIYGELFHFDGLDWQEIKYIENPKHYITDIWTNGSEIFLVSGNGHKSFVYHGR